MASIINNLAVWGLTTDEYGSTSYITVSGNTNGFSAGKLIYAQEVNKAFRNATILPYAFAQMLTGINWIGSSDLNIGFSVAPNGVEAFCSNFKSAFNSYIQSAIKVSSAALADTANTASAFASAKPIVLTGNVVGSTSGSDAWYINTTIAPNAITTNMIASNAITSNKIAVSAIVNNKISSFTITGDKLSYNTITSSNIGGSAVTADKISRSAVTSSAISSGAVYNENIHTPWIAFSNATSVSISLGSVLSISKFFGFNSNTATGNLRYLSSNSTIIVEEIDEGENWKIIPNNYTSGNQFISMASWPYASTIGISAFAGCINLSTFKGSNVSYIMNSAFNDCTNLSSISIPNCQYIGNAAFNGCRNLTSIIIPYCEYIGSQAFASTSLTTIDLHSVRYLDLSLKFSTLGTNLENVYIDNIEEIYDEQFMNCTSLKSLINNSPDGFNTLALCSKIGSSAFNGCHNLTTINLPRCTSIGADAFANCYGLDDVFFPSITTIPSSCFRNCSTLLFVPNIEKITTIQEGAFSRCIAMQSISLYSCSILGVQAFRNCTSLNTIRLGQVTNLGNFTFSGCSNLRTIYIECDGILNLMNSSTTSHAFANVFGNSPMSFGGSGIFYVRTSLYNDYRTTAPWSLLPESRIMPSNF